MEEVRRVELERKMVVADSRRVHLAVPHPPGRRGRCRVLRLYEGEPI
jgi:hypothetical protein